jgi:hypothetical protein
MILPERIIEIEGMLSAMEVEEIRDLPNRMKKEQPFIMLYLLAVPEGEGFSDEEGRYFFYVGMVIWLLMRGKPNGKRKITKRTVRSVEQETEVILTKMDGDSPGDLLSAVESLISHSPEPVICRYIGRVLAKDDTDPENPPLREEHIGRAFLYLKIVLDAFIECQK